MALLALLVALAGCAGPRARYAGVASTASTAAQPASDRAAAVRDFRSVRHHRRTPAPCVEVPGIGVDTALQRLGQDRDGAVEVPSRPRQWEEAGWYDGEGGAPPATPARRSSSATSTSKRGRRCSTGCASCGPATRWWSSGPTARGSGSWSSGSSSTRSGAPTEDVYYPTLQPKLRLVTCGGDFDPAAGHYRDNVIVFASLSG